jgi:hypothetical protein
MKRSRVVGEATKIGFKFLDKLKSLGFYENILNII